MWSRRVLMVAAAAGLCSLPRVARGRGRATRIDLELQDEPIERVLELFARIGKVNIVARKGVSGRVTAKLRRIPWDEALYQILRALQLTMRVEGNIIWVTPD